LRLLFLPAMHGVGFRRHQLLHAEWILSKLSGPPYSSTLTPRVHSVIDARNFRACHQFSAHARYSLVTKPDRESNLYISLLRISLYLSVARVPSSHSASRARVETVRKRPKSSVSRHMKAHLTERAVKAVVPEITRDKRVFDDEVIGFGKAPAKLARRRTNHEHSTPRKASPRRRAAF
jgi:hypothetical protein